MGRSRGLSWFQFYGRGASFFATYVNPVGLARIAWKWLLVYCCWLVFELVFIYFFFPETAGRTLEELSFCKWFSASARMIRANVSSVRGQGQGQRGRCRGARADR